jgi:hypothetical protein
MERFHVRVMTSPRGYDLSPDKRKLLGVNCGHRIVVHLAEAGKCDPRCADHGSRLFPGDDKRNGRKREREREREKRDLLRDVIILDVVRRGPRN